MPSDHEKWDAVRHSDSAYDGVFFYGVKTTGVFCRPSCRSRIPLRKNVRFFESAAQAYAYGLRPCKRCRPDLLEFTPKKDLADKAKAVFDHWFADRGALAAELKALSVSQNHLINLFRQQYDMTPVAYLNRLRVNKAAYMLAETRINIVQVVLACGFGSLSAFYEVFKKQTGLSPNKYRTARVSN